VSTTLSQGAIRLLFVLDRTLSNRWLLRGGIGGGADWVNIETLGGSAENKIVAVEAPRTRWIPMLRGLGVARYAFTDKSELFFGVSVDFDLFGTRYVRVDVERDPATPTVPTETTNLVLQPWQFRPMALIGITADVLAY
jgi:hypothetical protein